MGESAASHTPHGAAATAVAPTPDEVRAVLATVVDPELGADIVSLGMVPTVTVSDCRRGGRHGEAHDRRLSDARRDQARGRVPCRRASGRAQRAHLLGRDDRRGAQRGDDQGAMERPPARRRHAGAGVDPRARHRQRQGRRRQELGHRQPGRGAGPPGTHRRRARRRHLGLLGSPPARRRRPPRGRPRRGRRASADRAQRAGRSATACSRWCRRGSSSTRTPR